MARIQRLANVTIYVYADDHAPPHFHVLGPNSNAKIEIATLSVMRGRCQARDLADVIGWAVTNQALLRAKWSELNERD
jgi:hypothetical protein